MKNYYQILGVTEDADEVVIKAAYRALSQKYHPDKWVNNKAEAHQKMAEINEAYAYLTSPIKQTEAPMYRQSTQHAKNPNNDSDKASKPKPRELEPKDLSIGGKAFVYIGSILLFGLVAGIVKAIIHYINSH